MAKLTTVKIDKNKNYTVMSNYHLRDKNLSLKAKGLMSFMLSLPPEWDFSVNGLSLCTKESKNTINSILHELIDAGYLERKQERKGKLFDGYSYILHEISCRKNWDTKTSDTKNEAQINTKEINTKEINTKEDVLHARVREEKSDKENDFAEVAMTFSNNIHPLSGEIERDMLIDLLDSFGKTWLLEAIKVAVENHGNSLKYIKAVLENWQRNGFKTKPGGWHNANNRGTSKQIQKSEEQIRFEEQLDRAWRNQPKPWEDE